MVYQWIGMVSWLCLVTWLADVYADDCSCGGIKVTLNTRTVLKNKGFHKDLAATVVGKWSAINSSALPHASCRILVSITLPPSAFIDPYQVDSQVHKNFEVLIPQDVDLETPAEKSFSQNILWYVPAPTSFVINTTLELPVTIRYHKPNKDGTTEFRFPPLSVFTRDCLTDDKTVSAPCDVTNSSLCTWIGHPLGSQEHVNVAVPVGYEHHTALVVAVTAIASTFGTLILAYVILTVKTDKEKVT